MIKNPSVKKLPNHLKEFIIDQHYEQYTGRNHAVWRYVMRRNLRYLSKVAHQSYINGLKMTGISIDDIPSLEKMNDILQKIGWGAVCVDGFIPPAAFMEFQKHQVLVIAADIRSIDQIEYTPAPDILHEAAGHAPIIADSEYAEYLRRFGEIGSKAFSSHYDHQLYEAIRHLSILKADPNSTEEEIKQAENAISVLENNPSLPSEMSLIRNLHWWTVEYGLIGSLKNPQIYGAGLLSSIGESVWALSDQVRKIPYSLEAMDYAFDITKPQPQLFVTPDFKHLNSILDEFAATMSMNIGGIHGMEKAIESKNLATAEFKSGLQISGVFTNIIVQGANVIYLQASGPSMLSYRNKMLEGHGPDYHQHGYGTALGKIIGAKKPMKRLTENNLKSLGIEIGKQAHIKFDSGLEVKGTLIGKLQKNDKLLLLSFENCEVQYQDQLLFQPEWGIYDLAIGEIISSVYPGVPDPESYGLKYEPPAEVTHKIKFSDNEKYLFGLYKQVRVLKDSTYTDATEELINEILAKFPKEWLLQLEALEFIDSSSFAFKSLKNNLQSDLFSISERKLIDLGIEMID